MKLVVGLGNPGREYAATRHNVGFCCVDILARRASIPFNERRKLVVLGTGRIAGHEVALAKPRTFMNNSGDGVKHLLARLRITPADLVVIHDDMDLPVGKVRLRPGGSAAGHKGILSIIAALGAQEFSRVRIGIDRPAPGADPVDYVLGQFAPAERALVEEAVRRAADAVEALLLEGLDAAMNRFN